VYRLETVGGRLRSISWRRSEVVDIDPDDRTVTARHDEGEVVREYDRLLVATGSEAATPPIKGLDHKGVFTLGSMSDDKDLREYVARSRTDEDLMQPDCGESARRPPLTRKSASASTGPEKPEDIKEDSAAHIRACEVFTDNHKSGLSVSRYYRKENRLLHFEKRYSKMRKYYERHALFFG